MGPPLGTISTGRTVYIYIYIYTLRSTEIVPSGVRPHSTYIVIDINSEMDSRHFLYILLAVTSTYCTPLGQLVALHTTSHQLAESHTTSLTSTYRIHNTHTTSLTSTSKPYTTSLTSTCRVAHH